MHYNSESDCLSFLFCLTNRVVFCHFLSNDRFYQIRVSHKVTSKIIHKIEVNYSKYASEALSGPKHHHYSKHHRHKNHKEANGGDRPSIVFPPCIVNGAAVSKTFQIFYKNEEVPLNDVISFKTHLILDASRCIDQVKRIPFTLTVELWFTEQEFGPEHHSSIECVSSRQLRMHVDLCRGLHCHLPVIFDYFHLSAVTMSVHATLITLCQPYLKHNHYHHHKNAAASGSVSPSFSTDSCGYDYLLFGCSLSNLKDLEWSEMQLRLRRAQLVHWQLCSIIFASMNGLENKLAEYKIIQSSSARSSSHHSSHHSQSGRHHRDHHSQSHSRRSPSTEVKEKHHSSSHSSEIKPSARSMSLLAQSCYKSCLEEHKSKDKSNQDFIAHQNEVMSSSDSCQIPSEVRPGDYITLVESDLAYLSGLSILQWEQFLKLVIHSEKIAHFLSRVHHFQRIKRFSEGFFAIERARHSIISVCDATSTLFSEVSEAMRKSAYFMLLPSCDVECLALDGDSSSLPIIFEEKYGDDDDHHRHRRHSLPNNNPTSIVQKIPLTVNNEASFSSDLKQLDNKFPKLTLKDEHPKTRTRSPSPVPVDESKKEQKRNLKQKLMNKLSISSSALSSASNSPGGRSKTPSPSPSPSPSLAPATSSGKHHRHSKGTVTFAFDVKPGDDEPTTKPCDRKSSSPKLEERRVSCSSEMERSISCSPSTTVQMSRFTVSRIPSPTLETENVLSSLEAGNPMTESRSPQSDKNPVVNLEKEAKKDSNEIEGEMTSKKKKKKKIAFSESLPDLRVTMTTPTSSSPIPSTTYLIPSSPSETQKDQSLKPKKPKRRSKSSSSGDSSKQRLTSDSESDTTFTEVFEGTIYFPRPPPEFSSPTFPQDILTPESDALTAVSQEETTSGKGQSNQRSLERRNKKSNRHESVTSSLVKTDVMIPTESQFTFHELLRLRKCLVCEAGKSCTCNAPHLMENLEMSRESTSSYTGSSSPSLRRTSAVSSRLITFLEAKEDFRREKGQAWNIYSDFPSLASKMPYFSLNSETARGSSSLYSYAHVHLVVCVHGLDGNSADLRLIKTYLELGLPTVNFDFLMSQRNQGETFDCFETLTDRLVKEIVYHIEVNQLNPDKIR